MRRGCALFSREAFNWLTTATRILAANSVRREPSDYDSGGNSPTTMVSSAYED